MKALAILVFTLIMAGAVQARTEVVIYKFVQTNIWTGGGTKFRQVVSGRMVLEVDAGAIKSIPQSVRIFTWLPNGRFQVDCPITSIAGVRGPAGAAPCAWFLNGTAFGDTNQIAVMQYYLRGGNTDIYTVGIPIVSPTRLTGTYRAAHKSAEGTTLLGEGTLVVTYLEGATDAANIASQSGMEFINSLRQTWLGKGWVEVAPDAPCP